MFPGIENNQTANINELQKYLEDDLDENPSTEELTESLNKYVKSGNYNIEDIIYVAESSNSIFPEFDENSQLRIEKTTIIPKKIPA